MAENRVTGARSVDELFDIVQEYELVLTVDAPLADALNARLEEARLGRFAATPQGLVREEFQNEELMDRRGMYLHLVRETSLSPKQVLYALDNVLDCWRRTGDVEHILQYARFDTDAVRTVIQHLRETQNVYREMEQYKVEEEKVAVVSPYQFLALDETVMPDDAERVDLLRGDEQEIPAFKVFSSATGLVHSLLEQVTAENAEDVAVVMRPDGQYQALVESGLDARGIPFFRTKSLDEDQDVRNLLALLQTAVEDDLGRVEDVRPLLEALGIDVSVKHDKKRVSWVGAARPYESFLDTVRERTVRDALEQYADTTGMSEERKREIIAALDEAGFTDQPVTEETVQRLTYYLDAFDVVLEQRNEGVKFVAPGSTAIVDRPIVFYMGLEASWAQDIPEKEWVDRTRFEQRQVQDFALFLQNGEQQHFLVQDKVMNEQVTPCFYFDEVVDESFDTFTAAPHTRYRGGSELVAQPFPHNSLDVDGRDHERTLISTSRLDPLVWCPRAYMFDQVVDTPETQYMDRGTLIHEFAEFYVNFPEVVEEQGINPFIERMLEELRPFIPDHLLSLQESALRAGVQNVMRFVDDKELEYLEYSAYTSGDEENMFIDLAPDDELRYAITERLFFDNDIQGVGKIDLIQDPTSLVDFKTGGRDAPTKIIGESNDELREPEQKPTYQAMMYLSHHRNALAEDDIDFDSIDFTFYHVMEKEYAVAAKNDPYIRDMSTVTYHDLPFQEFVTQERTFNEIKDESKPKKAFLEALGFEKYRMFFTENPIPEEQLYNKMELIETAYADRFKEFAAEHGADRKGHKDVLKSLSDRRCSNYFKEDLDWFVDFVREELDRYNNEWLTGRFPVRSPDVNHRYFGFKDMIIHD